MTTATLTHLPLAAGSAMLASAGRAALWALSHYMRAPLANTAILSMVTLMAMAGSNALYFQAHKHPAPLFAPAEQQTALQPVVPVIPAVRPKKLVLAPIRKSETTGSIAVESKPVGNAEVFELQRKLEMLELFDGTVDGYYGPRTARAIKKFEELNGMKPRGELTAEIVEAIRKAPAVAASPVVEALSAPEPLPAADALPKVALQPVAAPEPLAAVTPKTAAALAPLPAPEPLPLEVQPASPQPAAQKQPAAIKAPMGRQLPDTPQEAFNLAVETAGDAIDTIIDGVQTVTMTKPPARTADVPLAVAGPEPEAVAEVPVLDTGASPEDLMPAFSVTDPVIVARVQRGLASLGFLHGPANGVAGEATAKAIRNFEVYYNYKVTGRISPELLDLLVQNGASI